MKEEIKKSYLNEKEQKEIKKIHDEFDKTIFGKRIKTYGNVWTMMVIIGYALTVVFFAASILSEYFSDFYDEATCFAAGIVTLIVSTIGVGISLILRSHYEHMAMIFAYENKLLKK